MKHTNMYTSTPLALWVCYSSMARCEERLNETHKHVYIHASRAVGMRYQEMWALPRNVGTNLSTEQTGLEKVVIERCLGSVVRLCQERNPLQTLILP